MEGVPGEMPKDMKRLAKVGHSDDRDAATRVALIYADGNNVGTFSRSLRSGQDGHRPGD